MIGWSLFLNEWKRKKSKHNIDEVRKLIG